MSKENVSAEANDFEQFYSDFANALRNAAYKNEPTKLAIGIGEKVVMIDVYQDAGSMEKFNKMVLDAAEAKRITVNDRRGNTH